MLVSLGEESSGPLRNSGRLRSQHGRTMMGTSMGLLFDRFTYLHIKKQRLNAMSERATYATGSRAASADGLSPARRRHLPPAPNALSRAPAVAMVLATAYSPL